MELIESSATLNTIVTGQICCGDKYLSSILCDHPNIICHSVLLDEDDAVRRYYHEDYFGNTGSTPDWLVEGHISGEQYLTNKIFDNPLNDEKVIGVSVLYPHLYAQDLWDYFSSWCRAGDFCVINLKRNPVACFVSLKLWERADNFLAPTPTTKFDRGWVDVVGHPNELPVEFSSEITPIQLDIVELYSFIRMHLAADIKTERMCEDRLEISYEEFVLDFPSVCPHISSFLGCDSFSRNIIDKWSTVLKLKNGDMSVSRIVSNWHLVCEEAPSDIKPYLDSEAL